MIFVGWPAIIIDPEAVAAILDYALGPVVAFVAERLQLAQLEFVPVALVRLDMIGDTRGHGAADLTAYPAQRLIQELQPPPVLPEPRFVKSNPRDGLRAHAPDAENITCLSMHLSHITAAIP
jgi:hypothetical protein